MKDGSTEDDNIVGNDKGRKTKEKKKKKQGEKGEGRRVEAIPLPHEALARRR
jgi:hypothetical protein